MQYENQIGRKLDGGREEVRTCFGDGFVHYVSGYWNRKRCVDLRDIRT